MFGPTPDPAINRLIKTAGYQASPEERARQDKEMSDFFNDVADGAVYVAQGISTVLSKAGEVLAKRFRPTQTL